MRSLRSFEHAAHGFGAEKALLLLVSPANGEGRPAAARVRSRAQRAGGAGLRARRVGAGRQLLDHPAA
jgi:hypothetical protein